MTENIVLTIDRKHTRKYCTRYTMYGGVCKAGTHPGEYKNSGDGFCYVDWAQGFHVFLIVLFLLPTTCVVVA